MTKTIKKEGKQLPAEKGEDEKKTISKTLITIGYCLRDWAKHRLSHQTSLPPEILKPGRLSGHQAPGEGFLKTNIETGGAARGGRLRIFSAMDNGIKKKS